ncbi:MAG: acyltransferase family protein [Sphingobium phenoxybenzoativorans]
MTYISSSDEFRSPLGAAPAADSAPTERAFRKDINALRAIAASIVVLFHFRVGGFAGGFVGVDIFFVISGLLMMQIIERKVAAGRFSVLEFYLARTKRIVPALASLCVALLIFGTLFLDPMTLSEVARNALASLLFLSNVLYSSVSSYFAEAAETNWLLHTWTLSVEWQFYLALPVVMALASRSPLLWRHRKTWIASACILSFLAAILIAGRSESFEKYAFFLLPTRAWEMLAGAWLAIAAPQIKNRALNSIMLSVGLAAIVFSTIFFDAATSWPSLWTAIPVLGTLAVLAAARGDAGWTRTPGIQALGTWSYSLYLWHWPIFVGFTYFGVLMGPAAIACGLALSVLCAMLSYELFETRLRDAIFGRTPLSWRRAGALAAAALILVAIPVTAWKMQGFEAVRTAAFDSDTKARLIDYRGAPADWKGMSPCKGQQFYSGHICVMGAGKANRVAIIGDSHAEQMLPRLAQLSQQNAEITVIRQQGCPPLPTLFWSRRGDHCHRFTEKAFEKVLSDRFDKVIIISAWVHYFDYPGGAKPGALCAMSWRGCRPITSTAAVEAAKDEAFASFSDHIGRLTARGVKVAVVQQTPDPNGVKPHDYYQGTFFGGVPRIAPEIDRAAYLARASNIRNVVAAAARRGGATIIDPVETLCGDRACPVYNDGHYLYTDTHHTRATEVVHPRYAYLDKAMFN